MAVHQMITVGQVLTTHGHRGELKVMPLTDYPNRFSSMPEVYLAHDGTVRKLSIESVRPFKKWILIKFKEIQSLEEAGTLRGALLQVQPENVLPLPEGHYYLFQLVGLLVLTVAGEEVGRLTDIYQTSANDVYVVTSNSGKTILIPALKDVVKEIDLKNGKMHVTILPGL